MNVPELVKEPVTVNEEEGGAIKVPIERVKSFAKSMLGSFTLAVTVGVPAPLFVISKSLFTTKLPERIV